MTEESTIEPPSKKGLVRQQLHNMIFREVEAGQLQALIARAADFYGPDNQNSMLGEMVIKNFKKGKKAQVMGDPDKIHTYTYTPDAGKATALLGNTPEAFNQVWHLPTTKEKLTTRQWIELIADEMHVSAKIQKVPAWLVRAMGLVIPVMREFPEMIYQYEEDYVFDSSKFEEKFGIMATPPVEGIKETLRSMGDE